MYSPVGNLKLIASDKGLVAIQWKNNKSKPRLLKPLQEDLTNNILLECERQLLAYFSGELKEFSLPLDPIGTPFQIKVWQALATIPFGQTKSYGQIASQIEQPKAVRAVGAANGKNPIPIIVPCHRVIGSNGKLVGFAGGLSRKEFLLKHESVDYLNPVQSPSSLALELVECTELVARDPGANL